MADKPAEPIQLTVNWDDVGTLPTMATNAFLVQQTPHEFILNFAFVNPPIFLKPPTPEELAKIGQVEATKIVRLAMSPGRVVELLQLLQQQLAAYQQSQKQ